MTERQKQHQGRSESDDTTLEGRDVRAGAVSDSEGADAAAAPEDDAESSAAALHIEDLLKANRKGKNNDASGR